MNGESIFDITNVCKELGISSRTLRYYEEIGLIESTKSNISTRRRYTKEQVEKVKYILSLRTIGLSIKAIQECLNGEKSIKEVVNLHRAQILMLDIDHFKTYNNKYGHQQGDVCLQAVASILSTYTDKSDFRAIRYGGEEFSLILSGFLRPIKRCTGQRIMAETRSYCFKNSK